MTSRTCASLTSDLKAGRYVSHKSRGLILFTFSVWRLHSGPECTAKCLAQASSLRYFASSGPCNPFTTATPIREVRYGSSPYVSWPRPQRGSLKILILGVHTERLRKRRFC